MIAKQFSFVNWRNLKDSSIQPCESVNVFYGDNGQGKTNLLEAMWICSGAKSFRGAKDQEMMGFGEKQAKLTLDFVSGNREQQLIMQMGNKKTVSVNGVEKKQLSELYETVFMVVFAPVHLGLVKDGPGIRRQFMDFALGRLKPSYLTLEDHYNRALDQRNAMLREPRTLQQNLGLLELWEDALARLGSLVARQRKKYVEKITPFATEFYHELSGGQEMMEIFYDGSEFSSDDEGYEKLKVLLETSRENDIKMGYTTVGPHRHDLMIHINGISARTFGSQGQQRSAALSLKMAEAEVLSDYVGEKPMILLDDVMSELDSSRQNFILNKCKDRQIFITCCEPASVLRLTGGKSFLIQNGDIHEQT